MLQDRKEKEIQNCECMTAPIPESLLVWEGRPEERREAGLTVNNQHCGDINTFPL